MGTNMRYSRFFSAVSTAAVLVSTILWSTPAEAGGQRRHGPPGHVGGGRHAAVVSGRPVVVWTRVVPYRPYYYRHRPGLTVGFYAGYPYGYYPRYYHPHYAYAGHYSYAYGYGYGYPLPPASYVTASYGVPYGGVRIEGAPREGQV